jgi:hypothetical protein
MPNDEPTMVVPSSERRADVAHRGRTARGLSRRQLIVAFILFNIAVWGSVLLFVLR